MNGCMSHHFVLTLSCNTCQSVRESFLCVTLVTFFKEMTNHSLPETAMELML